MLLYAAFHAGTAIIRSITPDDCNSCMKHSVEYQLSFIDLYIYIYNIYIYTPTIVVIHSRGVIILLAIYKIPKLKYVFVHSSCRPSKSALSRWFLYIYIYIYVYIYIYIRYYYLIRVFVRRNYVANNLLNSHVEICFLRVAQYTCRPIESALLT